LEERIAVFLARELKDGETVWAGTNLPVPRAAILLAHLTRCPNLNVLLYFYQHNFTGRAIPPPSEFFTDGRLRHGAEMELMGHRAEYFNHIRDIDVFFVGGLQVDRYGNTNLIGLRDPQGGFLLRGAGPAGASSFSAGCGRYYIYMTRHDPRSVVERCDFVSTVGHDKREKLKLPGGGPKYLITPKGIFDFVPEMRLRFTYPGISPEEVQESTGFPLAVAEEIEPLPSPTEEELEVLRGRVDPEGRLRKT